MVDEGQENICEVRRLSCYFSAQRTTTSARAVSRWWATIAHRYLELAVNSATRKAAAVRRSGPLNDGWRESLVVTLWVLVDVVVCTMGVCSSSVRQLDHGYWYVCMGSRCRMVPAPEARPYHRRSHAFTPEPLTTIVIFTRGALSNQMQRTY